MDPRKDQIEPRVRMLKIATALAVPSVLQELGADPRKVLGNAGFDIALFDSPDIEISSLARARLLAHCARATRCPHFGLLVGHRAGLQALGLVGVLVRHSPDLRTALERLVRHFHLRSSAAAVSLSAVGDYAAFAYDVLDAGAPGSDQVGDGALASMVNIMRELCGANLRPTEVWFAHRAPLDVAPYREVFGATLHFDRQTNAIVFPSTWLSRPVANPEPALDRLLAQQIELLEREHGDDFVEQVSSVVRAALTTGGVTPERVASVFSMHARTLHRHLSARGVSFRRLLDRVRFETAMQKLRYSSDDVASIAEQLDYADAQSFIRAFRRWSGTTPGQWRTFAVEKQQGSPAIDGDRTVSVRL